MTSAFSASGGQQDRLFDRNRRFVNRMLLIAAPNKPVFVAIGALHLGGGEGVLQLLRQHGFIVEPY